MFDGEYEALGVREPPRRFLVGPEMLSVGVNDFSFVNDFVIEFAGAETDLDIARDRVCDRVKGEMDSVSELSSELDGDGERL